MLNASGPVPEAFVFPRWVESLDNATAKIMKARNAQNPCANNYERLWGELDAKMGRSAAQTQRGKLECLALNWQGRVTMKDFDLFDAEFRLAASDQSYLTQREAAFIYARKLPSFLLEKVEKEKMRQNGKNFVLLRGLQGMTITEVKDFVQGIVGQFPSHTKKLDDAFLVGLHCNEHAQILLSRNQQLLSTGRTFLVEISDFLLTIDDIAELVRQTLEPREAAEEIKKNFGQQKFKPKARIEEIEMEIDDEQVNDGSGGTVNAVGRKTLGKKSKPNKKNENLEKTPPAAESPSGEGSEPSKPAGPGGNVSSSSQPPPPPAAGGSWNGNYGGTWNSGNYGKGKGKSGGGRGWNGGKGEWNGGRGKGKGKGQQF